MASHEPKALDIDVDVDRLKTKFDLSHFDLNAVLRGIQLTLVGGLYLSLYFRNHLLWPLV